MDVRKKVTVEEIESLLSCLPGVQRVRVVVNDWGAIEEVHVLTGLGRSPKQIVRDILSALKAQWNITLDRKKVSVAQVQVRDIHLSVRLILAGLEIMTDQLSRQAQVSVRLQKVEDDRAVTYSAKCEAEMHEAGMLMAAARACVKAANLTIEEDNFFTVEDVVSSKIRDRAVILVLVNLITPGRHEDLLGAALVRHEPLEATVRATLDAINRRLEALPPRGSLFRPGRMLSIPEDEAGDEEPEEVPLQEEPDGGKTGVADLASDDEQEEAAKPVRGRSRKDR